MASKKIPKGLKKILRTAKTAIIGDSLVLFHEADRPWVKEQAKKAMLKGEKVKWDDGRRQKIDEDIVFDPEKAKALGESQGYIWDKNYNKVLHSRTLVTKYPDGTVEKKKLRSVYKTF